MTRKSDRARGLSKADRVLWDHVARSVSPIDSNRFTRELEESLMRSPPSHMEKRAGDNIAAGPEDFTPARPPIRAEDIARAMTGWQGADMAKGRETEPTPSRRQNVPGLDRRTAERLRKGQMEIDGRIDLHGLTRAEAHRELRSYISAAHIRGMRCVLVITGKGSSRQKTDDAAFMGTGRSGILREAVPQWLSAPDLAHLIVDIRHAQPKHGGSGALYVLLRRRR